MNQILILVLVFLSCSSVHAQWTLEQAEKVLAEIRDQQYTDLDSAITICESIAAIYDRERFPCRQSKALALLSSLHTRGSQYERALELIQAANEVYNASVCPEEYLSYIYLSQSNLHIELGEYEQSDSIAKRAIRLYDNDPLDPILLIKLYLNLGKGNRALDQVMPYLDTAYLLAKQFRAPQLEQKALIDIGSSYAMNDSIDLAKSYLKMALKLARKRDRPEDMMVLYNNLAGLSDDEEEVLQYIDSAIYFAIRIDNIKAQQVFTENKAYFLSLIGQYEDGYNTLWKAFALKDSVLNVEKYKAIAEMEEKYEAEKKSNEIKELKLENLNTEVEKLRYKRNQTRLFIGSGILFFVAIFLGYSFVIIRKNRNILARKNREISEARKQSDDLLLNILPKEIASELKEKGRAEARHYDRVSILFTDIVHFTQKAESLSTEELIEELNFCFKGFDQIVEQFGVEKIKTIGDSYMAAGGIPVPSRDSAKNTVLAALEMQTFLAKRKEQMISLGNTYFEMRAGINTGPVVAGIVGDKKFQYDVWGDTVNTASRMESHGLTGKVNISHSTYELIKEDPQFSFETRGWVEAKGKGKVRMYFVEFAAVPQAEKKFPED